MRNFDYILFSFIFSTMKPNIIKLFSLAFFSLILFEFQIEPTSRGR